MKITINKSLKDIGKLTGVQIALRPLQIAKSVIVAKYLGPEAYGILKSVELINMLNKFGSLGFKPTIIRNGTTAIAEGNMDELRSIKNNAYSGEILLSLVLLLIGLLSTLFFNGKIVILAIILASIGLFTAKLFGIFQTELQLNKKFGSLAKVILYQGIFNSILVIATVPFYNIYAVLVVPIISSLFVTYKAYGFTGRFFSFNIDRKGFLKVLKVSVPLTFGTLAYGLFRYTERIIIISYMGLIATGYFGFADTIATIFISLMLGSVMKVRGVALFEQLGKGNYKNTHKIVIRETCILIMLSFLMILFIFFGMTIFVPLILPKWEGAILPTILYSFIIPIKLLSSYIPFVIKSPTVNKLKFEPIMQIVATVIMIVGTYSLNYFDILVLNYFIIVVLASVSIISLSYIIIYYFEFYLKKIRISD